MKLEVLAFSQARERLGFSQTTIEGSPEMTPRQLLANWSEELATLSNCRVAVDQSFHDWDAPVGDAREIAILPPVSGG